MSTKEIMLVFDAQCYQIETICLGNVAQHWCAPSWSAGSFATTRQHGMSRAANGLPDLSLHFALLTCLHDGNVN